jgi:hypothetical protein
MSLEKKKKKLCRFGGSKYIFLKKLRQIPHFSLKNIKALKIKLGMEGKLGWKEILGLRLVREITNLMTHAEMIITSVRYLSYIITLRLYFIPYFSFIIKYIHLF